MRHSRRLFVLFVATPLIACQGSSPSTPAAAQPSALAPEVTLAVAPAPGFRAADGGFVSDGRLAVRSSSAGLRLELAGRAPLTLGAPSMRRDGRELAGSAAARVAADGGLVVTHAAVEERLTRRGSAVEQRWLIDVRPAGSGALTIAQPVSERPGVDTAGGLHFAGLRYGSADWLGADGSRATIRPRYVGGQVVLEVPASLVEHTVFPAIVAPVISPETAIDQPAPDSFGALSVGSARSASGYLVVWGVNDNSGCYIVGARYDQNGKPVGVSPQRIGSAGNYLNCYSQVPSVASDGTDYLVTWRSSTSGNAPYNIFGTIVRADGTVVQPDAQHWSYTSIASSAASIAYDGAHYLLAWNSSDGGLWTELADPTGQPHAAVRLAILLSSNPPQPAIAAGTSKYLVGYGAGLGQLVDRTTGQAVGGPSQFGKLVASQSSPSIAYDGANFLCTWVNGNTLYGGRVRESDGVALDPDDTFNQLPGSLVLLSGATSYITPLAAWDGSHFAVFWGDFSGMYGFQVASDGTRVGGVANTNKGTQVSTTNPNYNNLMGLAFADGAGLITASTYANSVYSTVGVLVSSDAHGVAAVGLPISIGAHSSYESTTVAASNGSDYLVAWLDYRPPQKGAIYAARVSGSTHQVIDVNPIVVRNAVPIGRMALTSDGTDYALGWWETLTGTTNSYRLLVQRINADGTLNGTPLVVSTSTAWPGTGNAFSIASDGTRYVVFYTDFLIYQQLHGRRFDATTGVFDATDIVVASAGSGTTHFYSPIVAIDHQTNPTMATYLVLWTDNNNNLWANRVRSALFHPLDTATPLSFGVVGSSTVDLTSDGTSFLVALASSTYVNGQYVYSTALSRVDALNGTVLDKTNGAIGVKVASGTFYSRAVFDGVSWLLASTLGTSNPYGLSAMRLSRSLVPVDGTGFSLSTSVADNIPSVASRGAGEALVAYTTFDSSDGIYANRVRFRFISDAWDGIVPDMTVVYDLTVPPDLTVPRDLTPPPVILDLTPPPDLTPLVLDMVTPPDAGPLAPPADLAPADGNSAPADLATASPHDAGARDLASPGAHDLAHDGSPSDGASGSGCGCDVGGRAPAAPPLAMVLAVLLFRRRRA